MASLGRTLVWARLRLRDSGVAEVFDCDGRTLTYDSEDSAQAALLDAEFRAFDGMDEDDANAMGFSLIGIVPPSGADEDALREGMILALPSTQ